MTNGKLKHIILCCFCIGILLIPFVFEWPGSAYKKWNSRKENRNITVFSPKIKYRKLFALLEEVYNDRVPFRSVFVCWSQAFHRILFPGAMSDRAIIGTDNFVFFASNGSDNTFRQYCGDIRLTSFEKNKVLKNFQKTYNYLASRNIITLFVAAPNKIDIYYDKLPVKRRFAFDKDLTPRQQIFEKLPEYIPEEAILDLTPALREARKKTDYPLYYRADTHWNLFGGYVGFREIMIKIAPKLIPPPIEKLSASSDWHWEPDDLWAMTGLSEKMRIKIQERRPNYPVYTGKIEKRLNHSTGPSGEYYMITQNSLAPDKRVVVFYRDSFGKNLLPFLSNCFAEVHYIWGSDISVKTLDMVKPDIVIVERVSRAYSRFKGPRIR